MATFVKNTDKSGKVAWQVKIRRKGFPPRTMTFPTKVQAQEWARRIEADMDTAAHPTNNNAEHTTLGDILIRYRNEVAPTHRGAKHEIQRISQLLREPMSECTLAELTPGIIAHWRDARLRTVAPGSVLREMTILRSAIKRARNEWGIDLRECPLSRVTKPKERPHRERRVSATEEALLYEGCRKARNPYLRPAIEFALQTAMRQGEIVSLEWRNVDLERRTARLPITKNGRSRVVPLSTRAIQIIRSLPDDTERVFEGFSTYSVKHAFVRLVARVKLHDLHFHDLRHEAISRLVERGLNVMEVASVSGHQTMQMLKRYTHLRAEDVALKLG
ncbi:site-specific integrase [Paraburkholderia caledonica]|uniref:Integrase n=1 Tax=Paraburkholderia caledonica TaxID=134536 RepID=A0AB73I8E8_9BURK|nr:integrase [Paraburkholderia caledonica]